MGRIYAKLMLGRNWKKYIPVILLIIVQCQMFYNRAVMYENTTKISYNLAIGDMVADFYTGVIPFTMRGDEEPFNIPAIWALYFIYFFAIIGKSVSQMSQTYEVQMALRCVSRKKWWKYQNLVLWMETGGYLFVTCLTFGVYGVCTRTPQGMFHPLVQMKLNGVDLSDYQPGEFFAATFVLSLLVMLSFAYIQYAVSVKGNAMIGILVSVILLVLSVFYCHPLLSGNYLMLVRQKKMMEGGVNPMTGIIVSIGIIIVASMIAKQIMDKKDLF